MTDIAETLAASGGVAHYSLFEAAGISRGRLAYAVRAGRLQRMRNDWFAQLNAPEDAVRSARVGGVATCLTVLKALGIWCVDDLCLHVAVPAHAGHLSSPNDRGVPLTDPAHHGVVLHPVPPPYLQPPSAVDTLDGALAQAVVCQTRENVIVSLDSALNGRLLTMARLEALLGALPRKYRRYLRLVDATAQSGLETKTRLRFPRLRIRYRRQVGRRARRQALAQHAGGLRGGPAPRLGVSQAGLHRDPGVVYPGDEPLGRDRVGHPAAGRSPGAPLVSHASSGRMSSVSGGEFEQHR